MSGPSGERCGYCYFMVDPEMVEDGVGWCKRYPPPHVANADVDKEPTWPPKPPITSWCGEFKLHPNMSVLMRKALIKEKIHSHEDDLE